MKFVHIADVHFDRPFTTLETKQLAEQRRLEQRNSFKKVIEYIKMNDIPYLFICGDLYENEYIRLSTIDYINKLFETIPNTKIYIVPGNHDPYLKKSYYEKHDLWAKNVKIFKEKLEKIEDGNVCIYGYGFEDFYMKKFEYENVDIQKDKINILLTHGSLDGTREDEMLYNPLSKTALKNIGFDYIALGHIHKTIYEETQNIVYPGSLISLGFDELGPHGMIVGEIDEVTKKVKMEFIKVDEKEFAERQIDITDIASEEELIEKINNDEFEENKYWKLILVGDSHIEINITRILKYIVHHNIIKIKNMTKIGVDLKLESQKNNLKGIFIKKLLEKIDEDPENSDKIYKAIEIGLNAFEK